MVTTNNPDLYEKMHVLRVHGAKPVYVHHVIGVISDWIRCRLRFCVLNCRI